MWLYAFQIWRSCQTSCWNTERQNRVSWVELRVARSRQSSSFSRLMSTPHWLGVPPILSIFLSSILQTIDIGRTSLRKQRNSSKLVWLSILRRESTLILLWTTKWVQCRRSYSFCLIEYLEPSPEKESNDIRLSNLYSISTWTQAEQHPSFTLLLPLSTRLFTGIFYFHRSGSPNTRKRRLSLTTFQSVSERITGNVGRQPSTRSELVPNSRHSQPLLLMRELVEVVLAPDLLTLMARMERLDFRGKSFWAMEVRKMRKVKTVMLLVKKERTIVWQRKLKVWKSNSSPLWIFRLVNRC